MCGLHLVDRVGDVTADELGVSIGSVGSGDRGDGVHVQGADDRRGELVVLSQGVAVEVGEVDGLSDAEPVSCVLLCADAEGGPFEAPLLTTDDAVLHEVAAADGRRARGGSLREVEAVVHDGGTLEEGVLPIGALSEAGRVGQRCEGDETGGSAALVHEDGVLFGVEQTDLLPRLLDAVVGVVGHLGGLALAALLGGHEDDPVSTTCAVNGGGCGVLQDGDALDVGRVEEVDAPGRDAVDDPQRLGVVERTRTADPDGLRRSGLSGVLGHLDTGGASLQCLLRAEHGHRGGVLDVDGAHSTGDLAPLLVAIADDDGLFQPGNVGGERVIDCGAAGDGHIRGLVPDVGERQGRLGRGDHQRVVSIEVGHAAVVGAFLDNGHPGQGCAVIGVGHLSGDGRGLCQDSEGNQPTQEEQESHGVV